ncbi:NACHT domain-containing protein [Marinobacter sp. DUT-3]|uniref:NACHT domain-containing protein n=1 Tax=Marinobacter sp. DUT-3 TaxID=3412036 RepID=UPI003D174C46
MANQYKLNMQFEEEVRFIAEAVWGLESGACQPTHYPDDPVVRELDGIARLRDVTHLVMVTTSTKLEKLKSDVRKLNAAEAVEKKSVAAVSKWLITKKQVDAQHIEHARQNNVTVLTSEQFKNRFFDGRRYMSLREVSTFGSARNPADNSVTIDDDVYVPLPMAKVERVKQRSRLGAAYEEKLVGTNIREICDFIEDGKIVVLLAPFGAGKSLTTREVFATLSKKYRSSNGALVPVCLNLREHWGQEYFDEMLERHARSIGFKPKEDLVVAWRAGLGCILLDGFDEVASQTIVRKDDKNFMREARRVALSGVRDFLTKVPVHLGAFICGRDHYFDNFSEMSHALGVGSERCVLVKLDEFTEEGANQFLKKNGVDSYLPDWLPKKPLILSYLIQNKLLDDILDIDASEGYGYAWDAFISRITERESELEKAVMDSHTLRNVMERLAYFVRSLSSGSGPITGNDLATSYNVETGQSAGEGVLAQLQRLPGLTQREQDSGSRSFVDPDMLAALQGGALARIISGQYEHLGEAPLAAISERAASVAAFLLRRDGVTSSTPISIIDRLSKEPRSSVDKQLAADSFFVSMIMSNDEEQVLDFRNSLIESAYLGVVDLEDNKIENISFKDCIIEKVIVSKDSVNSGIVFRGCLIGKVGGVANESGLPYNVIDSSCEVEAFDDIGTNNAVLQSDLDYRVKALLTIFRKLYQQSGAGRKISALTRGITSKDVSDVIPDVLSVLEKHEFVRRFNQVVHPVRKKSARVEKILNAPSISADEIIIAVKNI